MVGRSESIGYMDIHPELTEKNIRKGIALHLAMPEQLHEGEEREGDCSILMG